MSSSAAADPDAMDLCTYDSGYDSPSHGPASPTSSSRLSLNPSSGLDQPSIFLLPPEIRHQIWINLLLAPSAFRLGHQGPYSHDSVSGLHPAILRTCRAIHAEASEVLYGENTFFLGTPPTLPDVSITNASRSFGPQADLLRFIYPVRRPRQYSSHTSHCSPHRSPCASDNEWPEQLVAGLWSRIGTSEGSSSLISEGHAKPGLPVREHNSTACSRDPGKQPRRQGSSPRRRRRKGVGTYGRSHGLDAQGGQG